MKEKSKLMWGLIIANLFITMFILGYLFFKADNDKIVINNNEFDITGTVTSITKYDGGITMLVEDGDEQSEYDKAYVKVTSDTTIIKTIYSRMFKPEEIHQSDKVKVKFEGPVAESYPVQATAGMVWIIESKTE